MKSVEISESVFLDLISCKSKVEDIKALLRKTTDLTARLNLVREIQRIVNSDAYVETKAANE